MANIYDDGNHEFVGMDLCVYCGECKQLLLQTSFFRAANGEMKPKKGLSKYQSTSPEPCDKCKQKFKEDGVVPMIAARRKLNGETEFTNKMVFVRREAIQGEQFIKMMEEAGFLIMEEDEFDRTFIQNKAHLNA